MSSPSSDHATPAGASGGAPKPTPEYLAEDISSISRIGMITAFAVAFAVVSLRFYARAAMMGSFGLDDWLMVVTTVRMRWQRWMLGPACISCSDADARTVLLTPLVGLCGDDARHVYAGVALRRRQAHRLDPTIAVGCLVQASGGLAADLSPRPLCPPRIRLGLLRAALEERRPFANAYDDGLHLRDRRGHGPESDSRPTMHPARGAVERRTGKVSDPVLRLHLDGRHDHRLRLVGAAHSASHHLALEDDGPA